MHPELQPIFVKAVGKMECILWHKIGACLMITALNWHAVKDTRADVPRAEGVITLCCFLVITPDGSREESRLSAASRAFPFEGKLLCSQSSKGLFSCLLWPERGLCHYSDNSEPHILNTFFSLRMLLKPGWWCLLTGFICLSLQGCLWYQLLMALKWYHFI